MLAFEVTLIYLPNGIIKMYLAISIGVVILGTSLITYFMWKVHKPADNEECIGNYKWLQDKKFKS